MPSQSRLVLLQTTCTSQSVRGPPAEPLPSKKLNCAEHHWVSIPLTVWIILLTVTVCFGCFVQSTDYEGCEIASVTNKQIVFFQSRKSAEWKLLTAYKGENIWQLLEKIREKWRRRWRSGLGFLTGFLLFFLYSCAANRHAVLRCLRTWDPGQPCRQCCLWQPLLLLGFTQLTKALPQHVLFGVHILCDDSCMPAAIFDAAVSAHLFFFLSRLLFISSSSFIKHIFCPLFFSLFSYS